MPLVLITGGAGFIGANLLRQLDASYDVRVLDNLVRGSRDLLPPEREIDLIVGDIRDPDAVKRAMHGVDLVRDHGRPGAADRRAVLALADLALWRQQALRRGVHARLRRLLRDPAGGTSVRERVRAVLGPQE